MSNKILPTQAQAMAADLLEEVDVYIKQKKYYPALKAVEQLFEINQFDNDLIYKKAYLHYLVGEYDQAYHWLRVFSDNQGPDYRAYLLNVEIQLKVGKKDEAVKILVNFFAGYAAHYFPMDKEEAFQQLDEIVEKLKKAYKWNKLLRMCPAIKDYESQRRKALKQMMKQPAKTDKATEQQEPKIEKGADSAQQEETAEVAEKAAVEEVVTATEQSSKDLAVVPPKELAPMPDKDVALNPAKDVAVPKDKDVDTVPAKNVLNPMEKLVANYREKTPELEDEFRTLSYEELLALVKELWDKGRLGEKQQRVLVRQKVEMIKGAVEGQVLSLKKKIWLFNYIANLFRQRILFDEAIYLLRAALHYDDEEPILLKNLGYTLISNGEVEVGKKVLEDARLKDLFHQDMDFTLLDLLAECK